MKGSRRLRDKMKEIKLTDRSDITFNPLLIFSVLQLSGSSGDDQLSEGGSWLLLWSAAWQPLTTIVKAAWEAPHSARVAPPAASISEATVCTSAVGCWGCDAGNGRAVSNGFTWSPPLFTHFSQIMGTAAVTPFPFFSLPVDEEKDGLENDSQFATGGDTTFPSLQWQL